MYGAPSEIRSASEGEVRIIEASPPTLRHAQGRLSAPVANGDLRSGRRRERWTPGALSKLVCPGQRSPQKSEPDGTGSVMRIAEEVGHYGLYLPNRNEGRLWPEAALLWVPRSATSSF